jgi:hypothetical protein
MNPGLGDQKIYNQDFSRDLKAFLLAVDQPNDDTENITRLKSKHPRHDIYGVKQAQSTLCPVGSIIYAASCRVVDIDEDNTKLSRNQGIHSFNGADSIDATTSTVKRPRLSSSRSECFESSKHSSTPKPGTLPQICTLSALRSISVLQSL